MSEVTSDESASGSSESKGTRRQGRELALQMLYQWELTREPLEAVFESVAAIAETPESSVRFARELVRGTIARLESIDEVLAQHSEHWRLSRMAAIDRNILRLAIYELLTSETPKGVVINEAIEVAKRFSAPESGQFVNGILDAIATSRS